MKTARLRDRRIATTGLPQAQPLQYAHTNTTRDMIVLSNDVTLRIRPPFTKANYAPLIAVPVQIASMARGTLRPNTVQSKQRMSALKLSTQTGKY